MSSTPAPMTELPSGTVTFLFTDVEGSTRLWETDRQAAEAALARHLEVSQAEIGRAGGALFKTTGDGVYAAFPRASEALAAALAIQLQLAEQGPPVRMAVHTGTADPSDGDYLGPTLNRTARLLEAAHGGQVVVSLASEELARDELPGEASLRDLGKHRLRDLAHPEQVFQLVHPRLLDDFSHLRTLDARPHNLPLQLTSFVGRDQELDQVERLLEGTRLLTLVGVGGSGKTRLGLQAAAQVLERFPHGVWVVELARLTDPALIPQAVATTLGIPEQPGRPLLDVLADALSGRALLLMLDNCEHLIGGAATVADRLLHASPDLTILATSREGLGIGGETLFQVPPLAASSEAVELFVERAQAVNPGYQPDGDHALVAQICQRLDGMPLAIELAAARLRSMSVAQIAGRLDDRFRLLTGGSRTALPRQQTLEAAVEWSHQLLSEEEQLLFRRLAVFAGDFRLEAAEAICGQNPLDPDGVFDLLAHLVDKSLVVLQGGRYRLLETIRSYARAKLIESGESEEVRARHAGYYRELMEEADRSRLPDQQFFDLAATERDNLRAAFQWLETSGRVDEAARLVFAMRLFWVAQAVTEGRQWAGRVMELEGLELTTRARLRALLGYLAGLQGDMEAAVEIGGKALEEGRDSGDDLALALALELVAAFDRRDLQRARALGEEALELAGATGENLLLARVQFSMGLSAKYQGQYEEAVDLFESGVRHLREGHHTWHMAWVLVNLSQLSRYLDRHQESERFIDEAVELMRRSGDGRGLSAALGERARALWEADQREQPLEEARESLSLAKEVGSRIEAARALDLLGRFMTEVGEYDRAVRLLAASEALVSLPARWPPVDQAWVEEAVGAARQALGREGFHRAWSEGGSLSFEEAVAFGLEGD